MGKKQAMNNMEPSSVEENRSFRVRDEYDFTFIHEIAKILGCSQSTIYRTLSKAKIPIYHLPNRKGLAILHAATLWRLAVTPAFKKYVKRMDIKLLSWQELCQFKEKHECCSLCKATESGLLPMSLQLALAAVRCGLIPIDEEFYFPEWFALCLEGKLKLPLPMKTRVNQ